MNLIEELKPFEGELSRWKTNGALPQGEVKKKLAEIYERLHKVRPTIGADKINTGCPSCVGDMMKALYNNRNEILSKKTSEFKGVPQAKVVQIKIDPLPDGKQALIIQNSDGEFYSYKSGGGIERIETTVNNSLQYEAMKMHELRSLAKKKGIAYTNKTKASELIRLLNEK